MFPNKLEKKKNCGISKEIRFMEHILSFPRKVIVLKVRVDFDFFIIYKGENRGKSNIFPNLQALSPARFGEKSNILPNYKHYRPQGFTYLAMVGVLVSHLWLVNRRHPVPAKRPSEVDSS